MRFAYRHVLLSLLCASVACSSGLPAPAAINVQSDACAECRMAVSNQAFAAQIVAPGADALFFDDIGCLIQHVSRMTRQPQGAIAYVADHYTGEWVPANSALYTRNLRVTTPMQSHLVAHANAANQEADTAAAGGVRVTPRELFLLGVPDGTR